MNKTIIVIGILTLLAAITFGIIQLVKGCQEEESKELAEKSAELNLKVSVIDDMLKDIYDYYGTDLEGLCPAQRQVVTSAYEDLRAARKYQWYKKVDEGLTKINPNLPSLYKGFPTYKPPFLKWSEMPEEILEELPALSPRRF